MNNSAVFVASQLSNLRRAASLGVRMEVGALGGLRRLPACCSGVDYVGGVDFVGFDPSNVPGFGGGGVVDPSQQSGSTVSSKFQTQAQKDAAIATDQANVAQAQASVDALQAAVDSFRANLANVPGGIDENGHANDSNFQGMADSFLATIDTATNKLHQAETVRNTWQAQLAQDQATAVTPPQAAPQPAPQPQVQPQPRPAPQQQVAAPKKSSTWKWLLGGAIGAAVLFPKELGIGKKDPIQIF